MVLEHWKTITLDLSDKGIDVWDRELMRTRRWAWLRGEIEGLLTRPPLGYVRVQADEKHTRLTPLWGTRLQQVVMADSA